MTLAQANGWWTDLATRWIAPDAGSRVLGAEWEWRVSWPIGVLVALLGAVWLVALLTHRSRRLELSQRWRIALGVLRAAALAIPVLVLMQPHLAAQLERREPKTLAVLLDQSGSMSVADGPETTPTTRWERAVTTLKEALPQSLAANQPAGQIAADQPRIVTFLFDEQLDEQPLADPGQLNSEPSRRRTALGEALQQVRTELADEVLAGVVIVSDGADNASSTAQQPLAAARAFTRDAVPVHTCLAGNERPRDATVSLIAESPFAFPGDPVPFRVQVDHEGLADQSVSMTLFVGDRAAGSRDVVLPLPGEGGGVVERFEIPLDQPGRHLCRVELAAIPGELTTANNIATTEVTVIDEPLRVLYVEHWPRWQYRFLRNALQRDTARCQPHLVLITEDPATPPEERQAASFPTSPEELEPFDVVIIGDVAPQDLAAGQWESLHDHVVNDGAGLILIAGAVHMPASFFDTPLGPLLPFERVTPVADEDVRPFTPQLTTLGLTHPLMRLGFGTDPASVWRRLPPLQWYVAPAELKPGAVVLAERPGQLPGTTSDAAALVILQRNGRGSSLFVGTDETWRWRYETGNRFFYGFWGQAIQHVGMPHRAGQFEVVRIQVPNRPVVPGLPVPVSVAVDPTEMTMAFDSSQRLTLVAEALRGAASPRLFELPQAADSPFVYQGTLLLNDEGPYRLYVEGLEGRGETTIRVASPGGLDLELASPEVNPMLLRQIAELTGGRYVTLDDLPDLIEQIDLTPLRYRWQERIPLWDGWAALGLLTCLLTAEWILRKWRYLP